VDAGTRRYDAEGAAGVQEETQRHEGVTDMKAAAKGTTAKVVPQSIKGRIAVVLKTSRKRNLVTLSF
jgi:hypothetical protein